MEISFYRMRGWQRDIWFTDVNGVALTDWAVENKIQYSIMTHLPGVIGITVSDNDRIMFELKWGNDFRK